MTTSALDRAQGILYGQFIGDSLGSLVEFRTSEEIAQAYPEGVRELAAGGPFDLAAGQPTDDSELAVTLARSIVRAGGYEGADVVPAYERWAESDPVYIGPDSSMALVHGSPDAGSQENGALMRVSPLAVAFRPAEAAEHARYDAEVTHPNPLTVEVNAVYAGALSAVLEHGLDAQGALDQLISRATGELREFIDRSRTHLPGDFLLQMGSVNKAVAALVWELEHGTEFEESLVRVIGRGGDTDTNAAIAGAFLGGVYGVEGIPQRWRTVIDRVRPAGRPEEYWPGDVEALAQQLLDVRSSTS
ncbi:ADP-ribosylglycohydrolase family protein [Corynebacterium tapiri]|uniref:ADP-ribosylglycohydrolase family protein n=1 Tax=Corynebacterium tapiri TaxID=1448266 RepID=A0A5C4U2T4_9CORY|nr:ADP-ribosylglycohydrolase family protein [Corynebacterium tapiri]TNL96808.1 ADP-ribosylglycohydrolase family protein [Corynebacterium tapiri]